MRKLTLCTIAAAALIAAGCEKTDDGRVIIEKPALGTVEDTITPPKLPDVDVVKDTSSVVVPKVDVRRDTAKVVTPKVRVRP